MAGQLLPTAGSDLRGDREVLVAALRGARPEITRLYPAIHPYPWALSAGEVADLGRLLLALRRALVAAVERHARDARLRPFLALSPDEESLLLAASRHPYRPGAFRPDFLHDATGTPVVSEINARFPFNGFFLSHALDAALRDVPYRGRFGRSYDGLPGPAALPRALREEFGEAPRVLVVKGQERGYDIHLFWDFWPGCRLVRPEEAAGAVEDADLKVLELHQHELLERLPRSVLLSWLREGRTLNDIRTILLGHDKRLLAVFTSEVLRDDLDAEDLDILRRHVIPTYVVGLGGAAVRAARAHPRDWILKPNRLGKGEGLVIGRNLSPGAWRSALDGADPRHVLQRYVEQRLYEILMDVDGTERAIPMKVVGLLPALNDHVLGPGIYRAAPGEIVNVAGGGTILAPVLVAPAGPATTAEPDDCHERT